MENKGQNQDLPSQKVEPSQNDQPQEDKPIVSSEVHAEKQAEPQGEMKQERQQEVNPDIKENSNQKEKQDLPKPELQADSSVQGNIQQNPENQPSAEVNNTQMSVENPVPVQESHQNTGSPNKPQNQQTVQSVEKTKQNNNQSTPQNAQQNGAFEDISEDKESQVITYTAPWNMFALGFSNHTAYPFRLAISSFMPEIENHVQIIQLNPEKKLERKISFEHHYPPTKILFSPEENGSPDLLATSGETLKIFQIKENQKVEMKLNLKNDNEFSAPLTSFDWNPEIPNLVGTSSIDTTCTIWDLEKRTVFTQLIAHDKQVYDIHFSRERNIFASAGADGSIRQFDLRDLQHSSVLFETEKSRPILKLAWNRKEPGTNLLSFIEMDQHYITLLDVRKPSIPLSKLRNHKEPVNAIAWAPQSAVHMCSVGDDSKAYIWDLSGNKTHDQAPLLQYKADEQISNLAWSNLQKEWLAICFMKQLQILRL